MELNLNPVIFEIGFFQLRWYSLAYIFGFIFAGFLAFYVNKFTVIKITKKQLDSLVTYCIFGVIVGGRFGYVLFYEPLYFLHNLNEVFAVWKGGMSFHGGLIGVIIAIFLFGKQNNIHYWHIFDRAAFCVLPGLFFGRIANFINGELWGKVTDVKFAFIFPMSGDTFPRHPSQLYEALFEGFVPFVIFFFLLKRTNLINKEKIFSGLFLIFYGIARFLIEAFFREPHGIYNFIFFNLSTGQLLSFPMIILGLFLIKFSSKF